MNTYKITNITNLAGKRDFKFNSELDIEYVDNITKKTIKVKAGDTVYLTVASLPLSVHRLRVKNLITVTEVSAVELAKTINEIKPMVEKKITVEENEERMSAAKIAHNKKKVSKKEELVDSETDVLITD
jgi:hypothetical protein